MSVDSGKHYHKECTGDALATVSRHSNDANYTLFGACFCPFVQRVWIALEYLRIPYKYYEVDPYKKPQALLDVSPKGLVPGLKITTYSPPLSLNESTVILQYLEEISTNSSNSLLPSDPYARALVRLQADHVNRHLVPAFYRYLQAQDVDAQIIAGKEFLDSIEGLVRLFEKADQEVFQQGNHTQGMGLWNDHGDLGFVDCMVGPWIFRASNVLKSYRGFSFPAGDKFERWIDKLFTHPSFKATCSTEKLYLDSYERYAYNRPNTSQVADAINAGRGLP